MMKDILLDPSAEVITLKVPFKQPVLEERFLVVEHGKCSHFNGPFIIDDKAADVTCKRCGEKLNPMWVLTQLAHQESRWFEHFKRYQGEMQRLSERSKTKCQHCKKMTNISQS